MEGSKEVIPQPEPTKNEILLRQFKDLIPVISIVLVASALIKLFIIYYYFDIPIKYFFSLSELAFQLTDDIIRLAGVGFFCYFFGSIIIKVFTTDYILNEKRKEPPVLTIPKRRTIKSNLVEFSSEVVIGISVLLMVIIGVFFSARYYTKIWYLSTSLLALIIAKAFDFITPNRHSEKIIKYKALYLLLLGPTIFLMLEFLMAAKEVEQLRGGKYNGSIIETEKKTYTTFKDTVFVGKSENYVFLYRRKDSTSIIIPTSDIKYMELKTHRVSLTKVYEEDKQYEK